MRGRLLTVCVAVSLPLFAATVVLWVRSYAAFDWLKLAEVELIGADVSGGHRVAESHVLFCWRGRFGYVRSDDFFFRTGRAGSYRVFWWPASDREAAETAETIFVVNDMERRWNRLATPVFDRAGFCYVEHWMEERGLHVLVPCWSIVALTALWPAVWGAGVVRRRAKANRVAGGTCVSCGYDLRATPGRCPECGVIAGRAA